MLGNGVKETTPTTGTGTVALSSVTGFARFAQVFATGALVSYAIKDGNNWEWGIGTIAAGNTLERTTCTAKFDAGSYVADGTKLALSGAAEVFCDLHSASASELSNDVDQWVNHGLGYDRYAGDTNATAMTSTNATAGRTTLIPFRVPRRVKLTGIGLYVATGLAGNASAGIYSTAVVGGVEVPGALLVSAADLDTSASGPVTGTVSHTLVPGVTYWAALKCSVNLSCRSIALAARDASLGRAASTTGMITAIFLAGTGNTLASDLSAETFSALSALGVPGVLLKE